MICVLVDIDFVAGQQVDLKPLSVEIIKGFTKIQCILFALLVASDLDMSPESQKQLEPFANMLDKAWMVPVHAAWQHRFIALMVLCVI